MHRSCSAASTTLQTSSFSNLLVVTGVALAASTIKSKWLELTADFSTGLLFALGLGAAGMTQPTKVTGKLADSLISDCLTYLHLFHRNWHAILVFFTLTSCTPLTSNALQVSGFLGVMSGLWDPSLAFVMGGALLVALPGYQVSSALSAAPDSCHMML